MTNDQQINQFRIGNEPGRLDLLSNNNSFSAIVNPTYTGNALVPGQAVKVVSESGGVPRVEPCTSDRDLVAGFVNYDGIHPDFKANEELFLSMDTNVMFFKSAGPIQRFTAVKIDLGATARVASHLGPGDGTRIGFAFDGATAADQLIRVYIDIEGRLADQETANGALVPGFPQFLVPAQVTATTAPGALVEVTDGNEALPQVTAINAVGDSVIGVVVRAQGITSYAADTQVMLAQAGSTVYMTASNAIVRFAQVVATATAGTVAASAAGSNIVGYALDKAAAAATLRVRLTAPSFTNAS